MYLKRTSGFTLLEVVISLIILSLTLLSLDAMEIKSLRDNKSSYYFAVASNQLQSIANMLFELGAHESLSKQLIIWNQENKIVLPEGVGTISGVYPKYKIIISWGGWKTSCKEIHLGNSGCLKEEVNL